VRRLSVPTGIRNLYLETSHNEELNDLYSSPNIIRVIKSRIMRWAGHVARMGEGTGAYRILVGRDLREGDLLEDLCVDGRIILKFHFQEVGWGGGGMDWIDMAQDRDRWQAVVNAVMNLRVPQNAGNFLTS
jgi:hypothetical protein